MNEIWSGSNATRAIIDCVALLVFAWNIPWRDKALAPARWRDAGGWRRAAWFAANQLLPFAALVAAVVAEKTYGFEFYLDLPLIVAIFTIYLLWSRHIGVMNAIYNGAVMFLCIDFCVALANSIYHHAPAFGTAGTVLVEVFYAAVIIVLCFFLRRFAPTEATSPIRPASFVTLLLSLLPYMVVRSSDILYESEGEAGLTMEAVLFLTILSTFATFVGNYNAILAEADRARRLELEMEMREQQKRYEIRKETMEEVNRRYHDMVKYARLFAKTDESGSVDDYLEQRMTKDLDASSLLNTGNEILDMVLWESSEQCRKQDLRLVPSVNVQSDLSFMTDFDLRTIVGNALDNAIEAAEKVEDPEKREIRMKMAQVNQMIFLKVTNYFTGELRQTDGKLITSKDDKDAHGFGVENIRRAVESYDGSMLIQVQGDFFILTAMVPVPADDSAAPSEDEAAATMAEEMTARPA